MNYQENVTTKTTEAISLVKNYYANPTKVGISCIYCDSNVAFVTVDTHNCNMLHIVAFDKDTAYCPFKPIQVQYSTPTDNAVLFANWLYTKYGPSCLHYGDVALSCVDGLQIDNDKMLVNYRTVSDISVYIAYIKANSEQDAPTICTKLIFTTYTLNLTDRRFDL